MSKDREHFRLLTSESELLERLNQPLNRALVKQKRLGKTEIDYIPAHAAIMNANEVFGYGGWEFRVLKCEMAGQPEKVKGARGQTLISVCYIAHVELLADMAGRSVVRQDIGVCDSKANTLADAITVAAKGAVSDGLKRCLRTFGDYFGLVLYDEDRMAAGDGIEYAVPHAHTQTYAQQHAPHAHAGHAQQMNPAAPAIPPGFSVKDAETLFTEAIGIANDIESLRDLWRSNRDQLAVLEHHFPTVYARLRQMFEARAQELGG